MAYKLDVKIDQGATFKMRVRLTSPGLDLTGVTGRGKIRSRFTDAASVADFTVTHGTDTEGVYLDVSLSATDTAAIPLTVAGPERRTQRFAYDLEIVLLSGDVYRVLEGVAEVSPEATK